MRYFVLAILMSTMMGQSAFCQKNELAVKVTIKDGAVEAAKGFTVQGSVTNVSKKEQSIIIMGCDYADLWRLDNQSICFELIGCFKNIIDCKTIKPNETIDWRPSKVYFWKPDQIEKGDFTFKLGFKASFCQGIPVFPDLKILKEKTYWSDPVTVHVQ
jgi:hypothetical protein